MMALIVIKTPQDTLNLTDPELFSRSVNNLAAFEQPSFLVGESRFACLLYFTEL